MLQIANSFVKNYRNLGVNYSNKFIADPNFKENINIIINHLCPTLNELVDQHNFSRRVQHKGKTIASYNFICDHLKNLKQTLIFSHSLFMVQEMEMQGEFYSKMRRFFFYKAIEIEIADESSKILAISWNPTVSRAN